ncbi:MAG: hypothetical protein GY790_14990 [Bacteroidetes bacterium]|nr:hypothetical protein [Bacteroidota bacterium]
MKFQVTLLLLAALLMGLSVYNPATDHTPVMGERIEVGPGPEDMVLDTLHHPRLLISCSARREVYEPYGEIEAVDLLSMERSILTRYNEPDSLVFRPHGIYLDGNMLYVISHEREPDQHPILVYLVHGDTLKFMEMIQSSMQHSPNALVTGPNGEIYYVNDSGKRGRMIEKALKLKRASVVRLEKESDGKWNSQFMALDLGYPAGINRIGNIIFAGDAIQHKIHRYMINKKDLTPLPSIEGLKGNDNIRIHQGKILTCGHVKPLLFIRHAKNQDKLSPVKVFQTDPETGETETIFSTDGSQISGGSTAIIYNSDLYISQVFEPYILKIKADL